MLSGFFTGVEMIYPRRREAFKDFTFQAKSSDPNDSLAIPLQYAKSLLCFGRGMPRRSEAPGLRRPIARAVRGACWVQDSTSKWDTEPAAAAVEEGEAQDDVEMLGGAEAGAEKQDTSPAAEKATAGSKERDTQLPLPPAKRLAKQQHGSSPRASP